MGGVCEHGGYSQQTVDALTKERDAANALALRWLRKWQTGMDPTPGMLEETHALIDEIRSGNVKGDQKMENVIINGVEYAPVRAAGNRAVIVVDRGWIFAGDIEDRDGRIYLSRAVWVFKWSSVGFAAVVDDPVKAGADIRPIADLDLPASSEIFRLPVGASWGL